MRHTTATALLLAAVLALPAASIAQEVDTGTADFSRYVALGDSLTAAFWSGGLHEEVQRQSYPALIHRQVHGTDQGFEQPLVSAPGIPAVLELRSLSPLIIAPKPGNGQPINLNLPRPYNNLAVPGFKARDVVARRTGNPVIELILRGLATALEQAVALDPTFTTVWIGNNDVLGAATSGIVIEGVTLTPRAEFEQSFRTMVGALAASGSQLAVANLPSVTAIPFVTTIPPVLAVNGQPVLIGGQMVPLIGPNGPLGPGDRVLLTAAAALAQGIGIPAAAGGTGRPLGNEHVLDAAEIAAIEGRIAELNQVIATVAGESGAALVDIHSFFAEMAARGFTVGGVRLTNAFLTGGIFSYDGVHANPVGYAAVANLFIEAINEQFDAEIPFVGLAPFIFQGVGLPTVAAEAITPAQAASAVFTRGASEQLRKALRVPSTQRLLDLLDETPGGGDGEPPPVDRPGRGRQDVGGRVGPRDRG